MHFRKDLFQKKVWVPGNGWRKMWMFTELPSLCFNCRRYEIQRNTNNRPSVTFAVDCDSDEKYTVWCSKGRKANRWLKDIPLKMLYLTGEAEISCHGQEANSLSGLSYSLTRLPKGRMCPVYTLAPRQTRLDNLISYPFTRVTCYSVFPASAHAV